MESIKDYNHRIVSIEEGQPFECLVHKEDKRWNGWVCPLFTEENFNKFYLYQLNLLTNDNGEVREREFLEELQEYKQNPTYIDNIPYINLGGSIIWSYHFSDKIELEKCLRDILGQLEMDKIDTKQALETLEYIVNDTKGAN
tara:strand:- start:499 stop:924 length:426 start_codon:yes stop_codon:yes gene_type:complete